MSDLKKIDRLAIRSQVGGTPLGSKQAANWMAHSGVTYDAESKKYKFGDGTFNSFDDAVSEVYKNNPDAAKYQYKVETGGDFRGVMNKIGASGIGYAAGDMFAQLGSTFRKYEDDDFSEGQKATQSTIRGALNSIPVYGPIISAATGLVDAIGSASGLNLSNIDKNSAERAGVEGSAALNNVINSLPGVSMLAGIFGSRTDTFTKSEQIANLGGAYSGTMMDLDAAEDLSGKRVLSGKDKMNSYISDAKTNQNKMITINDISSTRMKGVTSEALSDYNNQRNTRYQRSTQYAVGKQGMKLMSIEEINRILNLRKESSIQEFKNGGVIGIDSSIIPEGKLHAHKHNLKDANPDLEDVTKKGIPIVTLDEGGELQQVAEIEKEEIIFRKEVTTKLEELYKDGSDEAMIEAGKLIAEELMTNTDDKTEEFINE